MAIHTKSMGAIILNENEEVALVSHTGNIWTLPKGHIEKGEEELVTVKREIFEETGIKDLEFVKKIGSYKRFKISDNGVDEDKSEVKEIHIFLFRTKQKTVKSNDPENPEARWVKKEQVPEMLTHKKDKEFFKNWLNSYNYPVR